MINNIHIQNFKAFKDTGNVRLGALNVLTGINGRGKSTLLQSLLLLSQSIRGTDNHTPLYLFTNGEWVKLGIFHNLVNKSDNVADFISISFSTDDSKDNEYELTYYPSSANQFVAELRSMKVNGRETFSEAGGYNREDNENDVQQLIPPVFSGYTPLLRLQNMYYIAAGRIGASDEEDIVSAGGNLHLDCYGSNILNVLFQQSDEFRILLEEHLKTIFDGATLRITADEKSVHLYMDSVDDGYSFSPVNVGYGYGYILSLLTAGMLAMKGDTLIIENPEAHLHPSAQAAFMRFLSTEVIPKGVQVFVETHSDHIVNASLLAVRKGVLTNEQLNMLFFSRSDSSPRVFVSNLEVTPRGRVKNPPRNFCDQYAMDLRSLMGL